MDFEQYLKIKKCNNKARLMYQFRKQSKSIFLIIYKGKCRKNRILKLINGVNLKPFYKNNEDE